MEEKEKKRDAPARIPAIAGTLLAWTPAAFTVFVSVIGTIREGRFLFDYLMPAELALFALAGGVLLLWAAKRTRTKLKWIGTSFVTELFFLGSILVIPSVTGLASGETEPAGAPFIAVIICLVLFILAQIFVGIGGILLWKDLYRKN